MMKNSRILSSSASTQKSLEAIRNGDAGLNERRTSILARVPYSNDWAAFEHESRDFLKYIGQRKSVIVSYITGYEMEFTSNIFDDFMEGGN